MVCQREPPRQRELVSSTDAGSSLALVGGALLTLPSAERLAAFGELYDVSAVFNNLGDTDRTGNNFTGLSEISHDAHFLCSRLPSAQMMESGGHSNGVRFIGLVQNKRREDLIVATPFVQ